MPRIVTAHVALDDGSDFVAEIANLTPHSVFVKTQHRLRFREPVTVTFFSVSIRGELAFISRAAPVGAVIVFDAPAETRAMIEARIPDIEVLAADLFAEANSAAEWEALESQDLDMATSPAIPQP